MSLLYQLLIRIAAPLVFIATYVRGLRDRSYRDRLLERFGYTQVQFAQSPIWLHAVSVGEVQAATPLIKRLLSNREQRPVLVTTSTPTGAARVRALFAAPIGAAQLSHAFLPYDTPGAVRRFLRRVQPHCAIIMETELWPNLLNACVRNDIPVVLGSARISPRTATRYQQLRALFAGSLPQVQVGAQTAADAERLIALGAQSRHVQVTGNIKFDIEIAEAVRAAGAALSQQWLARPVWIAGSTHDGEEEQILAAHQGVLAKHPDALLILAPRHPQRFAQVGALLKTAHVSFVTRSNQHAVGSEHTVLLLDTLGELTSFYAASLIAFVAGSLVPVGGHNLLEPAALSLPLISGPHTFNAPDVADRLAERGALRYVYSADELGEVVLELLGNAEERKRQGAAALAVVQESTGALAQLLALIQRHCKVQF
ncbi:MAG: lipid IV(A) 3-deoxy-D-manno-octulosonic acid transferase [Steroidobacteraceae bacterium]